MTDKKYTDEEIEKALSLCSRTTEVIYCDQCPLCGEYECNREMEVLSLDLINRQKAEIDRLKGSTIVNNVIEIQKIKRKAKVEAYKAFAERLKEKLDDCHTVSDGEYFGFDCGDMHECINTSLKEMVGEEDDR